MTSLNLLNLPDLTYESQFKGLRVAGVDEVGRGCLAGPVVACALILTPEVLNSSLRPLIRDSKTLTPAQREKVANVLKGCPHAFGLAEVKDIDTLNIHHATLLAQERALEALRPAPQAVLIDGRFLCKTALPAQAVIDGDAKCLSIAAASILAKVYRDAYMATLAHEYPEYGFEKHKGYGTPPHLRALKLLGPSAHHRHSFKPVREASQTPFLKTG